MNMNRRDFSASFLGTGLSAAALFAWPAARAQGPAPVEGREFTLLSPAQPPTVPGKIEVLEFFSYACPHCHAFEPTIEAWAKTLPADVALRRVPVPFLMNYDNFQHAYYALETIGAVDAVQMKIFQAIHVDRLRLEKPEDIAAFVAKNGVDANKFLAAFKSFSVATSVSRAKKMVADYKVESVPLLAIAGRWVTSPALANGGPQSLAVVDALVQRTRKG
jgi:thiol:disulfide interchange protein DsbA